LLLSLDWISFQTRTLNEPLKIKQQNMEQNTSGSPILFSPITKLSENNVKTTYSSYDVPILVEILKEDEMDQHGNRGTLKGALDTFSCIVSFTL
jgi:hypothetical protein